MNLQPSAAKAAQDLADALKESERVDARQKYKLNLLRAHQNYQLADGSFVEGITTVLKVIAKDSLIHVAWLLGTKGQDYRKVWYEKAADIGTIAHAMIEAYLREQEFDDSELNPHDCMQAFCGFDRFREWWERRSYKPVVLEHQMVSERLRIGATLDILAESGHELVLIDVKTGRRGRYGTGVYREHKIQAAGLAMIYQETTGRRVDKVYVARCGKEKDDELEVVEVDRRGKYEHALETTVAQYHALKDL